MFFRKNESDELMKRGALNALAAFVYILAVVLVITTLERFMHDREDGILAPVTFLMLFVLSAAVMATLLFGKPAMLYVDGKKKEAVQLVGWTLTSLACLTFTTLAVMTAAAR